MKKSLLFAASALVLAGCSNDEVLSPQGTVVDGPVAIRVSTGTKGTVTRADKTGQDAAELLGNNFVVEGIKGDGSSKTEVIDHYNVNYVYGTGGSTESNTPAWEYVGQDINQLTTVIAQAIKYWDFSQPQYDFIAFSKGKNTEAIDEYFSRADASKLGTTDAVYTVKGSVDALKGCYIADLVTVKKADYEDAIVTPKFRNMGAKVRVAFYETVPGYSVKNVKFYNAAWDGYNMASVGCPIIIADGLRGTDERIIEVEGAKYCKEAFVAAAIAEADVIISLSHCKGHEQAGYGGTIKNLGMGCGSRAGKKDMHATGKPTIDPLMCRGCKLCAKQCANDGFIFDESKRKMNQFGKK